MQDKIFKVKIFEVTHKSVKVFSLEIFTLYYGICTRFALPPASHIHCGLYTVATNFRTQFSASLN